MYCARDKIYWFAIYSRLLILILQFIFNLICPDHKSDAFISPLNPREQPGLADNIVTLVFGGLTRWDGQYFLHIAKYGYTYENTIAFYPLFPLVTRYLSYFLKLPFFFLTQDSVVILSAVLLNFVCFVKSALVFYDLSKLVLKDIRLSYKATILYCINPASIFFSAVYSESVFAFITFYTMYATLTGNPFGFLPMSLSFITRSNGLTNIGFFFFAWIKTVLTDTLIQSPSSVKTLLSNLASTIVPVFFSLVFSFAPLGLLQINNYSMFCVSQDNVTIPLHVVHHAIENGYHLIGRNGYQPPWCSYSLPLAYSYVQSKYWNVGFLSYYELKQVPNFLLAMPILFIMLKCVYEYWKQNKTRALVTFFLEHPKRTRTDDDAYPVTMFPFVVHGLFLTIFAIFFVHIQVSTRFLASSSPLVYWYCAILMNRSEKPLEDVTEISYEDEENVYSTYQVFFMTKKSYTWEDKLILVYFFGYIFLGCFMFSNFLPWT